MSDTDLEHQSERRAYWREHAECVGRYNPRLCNVCQWLAIFAGLDEGGAGPGGPS